MIKATDAIAAARALIGTPYSELDCINLVKAVIRRAPGGVGAYRTAGTNTLWKSAEASAKYRDLTWRQEGLTGAQAGMLAFKRRGTDVHHVGLVTGDIGAAASSHTHNYVPTSRTVNGKALSSNISLTYSDVEAAAGSHTHSDYVTKSMFSLSGSTLTITTT